MRIQQVTDTVHVVTGTNVNWVLVRDGDAVTVIDAGYPNDGAHLLASLEALGLTPGAVQAILLTHAHLDHMGGVPTLLTRRPVPVLTGAAEVAHAHRDFEQQITPLQMLRQCTHRAGRRWVHETVRAVLPHLSMSVPSAVEVPLGVPLDLPGSPVAVSTPGHTSGHTAYLLEAIGVVVTGDALVTAHPLLPGPPGPQLLPDVLHADQAVARRSLDVLGSLGADVIVPGHGEVLREDVGDAVARVPAASG